MGDMQCALWLPDILWVFSEDKAKVTCGLLN